MKFKTVGFSDKLMLIDLVLSCMAPRIEILRLSGPIKKSIIRTSSGFRNIPRFIFVLVCISIIRSVLEANDGFRNTLARFSAFAFMYFHYTFNLTFLDYFFCVITTFGHTNTDNLSVLKEILFWYHLRRIVFLS